MTEHLFWAAIFLTAFFGQATWMHLEEELQDEWGCKIGAAASLGAAFLSYEHRWFPDGVALFGIGVLFWIVGCYTDIIPHIRKRWYR